MNYLNGLLHYENIDLAHGGVFYGDGTYIDTGNHQVSTDSIRDELNLITRGYDKGAPMMVYLPQSQYQGLLFFNCNMDYIYYGVSQEQVQYTLVSFDETLTESQTTTNSSDYATYFTAPSNIGAQSRESFTAYDYQAYQTGFANYYSILRSVFDLSHLKNNFNDIQDSEQVGNYVFNVLDGRPDNSLFYKYALKVTASNLNSVTMTIYNASNTRGTAIFNSWRTAYDTGYQQGWSNGNASGYAEGLNSNLDGNTLNAFTYIGTAFNSVSQILSLEVLPNITLGLCFSIPLVFVLIMTIFKLVKK